MDGKEDWLDVFPVLRDIDDPAWRRLVADAECVTVPAGTVVFREGQACSHYLLVVRGAVKVQKLSESGREIVLYRVERGFEAPTVRLV